MKILEIIKYNLHQKLKKDLLTVRRIKLQREEKFKITKVERLTRQMKLLDDKSNNATEGEQWALKKQIKRLDTKMKQDITHLEIISDQIRVVNNLISWRSGFDNIGAKNPYVAGKNANGKNVPEMSTHFNVHMNRGTSALG